MENYDITESLLFEHRFWLQIMGDHARFIFFSLAPNEVEYLQRAQDFIINYDHLLEQARKQLSSTELDLLNRQVYPLTFQFREFKLLLLSLLLNSDVKLHLPPTFINDMLNELEEYLLIVNTLVDGQHARFHPLHYHRLWLVDAIGHAASVTSNLDLIEKDMIDKSNCFEAKFSDLNLKAIIMNGYLRTQMDQFPSLSRFNEQVGEAVLLFKEFLEDIRDQRMDGRILGTIFPLMADHMAREECYYLWKLSQSAGLIKRPDCDPLHERIEA
ncbi:DUF2935 domain-containing protein [Mobilitalea sibirica]|uniref:DUF2935 domain-containing protein n=1 Tax=Mobilitalea sibirica TaxID=1462919 RepID=A0A8J7KSG6_9FIRM|nr:DUF2935 domain-containing protein [Mobilitalea sibirica]MBH1940281.1 DUF2935 domain-containing protein [Mobilitalea sibirica]